MDMGAVDAVRTVLDAFETGRFSEAESLLEPNISVTRHGSIPADLILPGIAPLRQGVVSREELVGLLDDAFGAEHPSGRMKLRVDSIGQQADGRVAVRGALMRLTAGAGYGRPVAFVIEVREGRVAAVDSYHGDAELPDDDAELSGGDDDA
ncbi:MAG TPA: hypothetical protein VF230_10895 [Acidimicrobiales bacterium]